MKQTVLDKAQWLWLVNMALAFYNVGTIWLVQMVCYPLWAYVGKAEFDTYHDVWWRSIWGVILGPAFLLSVGAFLMLKWRPSGVPKNAVWLGIALQVLWIGGTIVWWGPLMGKLHGTTGPIDGSMYQQLMVTHWLRVAFVTAYGVLLFWMGMRNLEAVRGAAPAQILHGQA
jgi:hypothetical protein